MEDKLLRLREVVEITSLSRSTIYRMVKTGQFPQSKQIGLRAVRWKLSDINAWIDSRTSMRPQMWSPNPVQFGHQSRSPIRVWRQYILRSASHVVGPLLHQVSATFEQIRSRVGLFSRVAEGVGKGCL